MGIKKRRIWCWVWIRWKSSKKVFTKKVIRLLYKVLTGEKVQNNSPVHAQNVRFQNVRFQNVWFQNVWNVRLTKRQVYKTSGLQNVRFTKRQVFKTSSCKETSIYCTVYSVLVDGGNSQVLSPPSVSGCPSLSLWMSQPVAFLIFNYIITFLLYTNRSILQCGCSAILI